MDKQNSRFPTQKLGLALGGGGTRGMAHLGVLKYLEFKNIRPQYLAGTSAGAIVAALCAFDIPIKTCLRDLQALKMASFKALRPGELGLFYHDDLARLLEKRLGKTKKIEDSPIPLAIQATDIETGECIILTEGDLISSILASSCVPGIYIPQKIKGKVLVDGGLSENVPLSGLDKLGAEFKIGVNLNGHHRYKKPENLFDVISNSLDMAIDNQTKMQLKKAELVIDIDLSTFSRFQIKEVHKLFFYGIKAARRAFNEY